MEVAIWPQPARRIASRYSRRRWLDRFPAKLCLGPFRGAEAHPFKRPASHERRPPDGAFLFQPTTLRLPCRGALAASARRWPRASP
jgi:hypothetical protein